MPSEQTAAPRIEWEVAISGKVVTLTMTCPDHYEAIMLGETIGEGIEAGHLELELIGDV